MSQSYVPSRRMSTSGTKTENGGYCAIAVSAVCRSSSAVFKSGGGEIRTPVLRKIFRNVYVRIPAIDVFNGWPPGRPPLNEPSRSSRDDGRRTALLAQICVT